MSSLDPKILSAFRDKDFAHDFMDEIMNAYIATQIKTLRLQKHLTQKQLADDMGTYQERIAVLENVNNSSVSLNTLREIARALDLVVCVSFENFSRAIPLIDRLHTETLERTPREKDLFPNITWHDGETRAIDINQNRALRKLRTSRFKVARSSMTTEWSTKEIYAGK